MKNLTLTIAAVIISVSLFANDNLVEASICGQKKAFDETMSNGKSLTIFTISNVELLKCGVITLNDETWKIKSFTIGYTTKKRDYMAHTQEGNSFDDKLINALKERDPERIYVEKIIVINNNNEEKQINNFAIYTTD